MSTITSAPAARDEDLDSPAREPELGPRGRPGKLGRVFGVVGVLLVVQATLVAAFVVPGHKPEPHGVDIGLVGTSAAVSAVEAQSPGAFDVHTYSTEAEARRAIEHRDLYGAVVTDGARSRLLVASAASAPIAHMLQATFAPGGDAVEVADLKPLDEDDPAGATLSLLFLPLVVVCLPAILLLSTLRLSAAGMIGAVALFATLGGLAVVALVGKWIGAMPGPYLKLAGVAALTIFAIAMVVAGLERLLGHAGIGLGFLLFFLVGNPASANGTSPDVLPSFWRQISQYMPNGAGGTGLRNTAYFDSNAMARPLSVLSAYALAGVLLLLAGEAVRRRRSSALAHA